MFATTGKKWWRFLSGDFRRCKATFAGLRKNGLSGDVDEWLSSIDAIQTLKSEQNNFIDSAQQAVRVIGENFRNHNTDWQGLLAPLEWIHATYQGIASKSLDANLVCYLERQEFTVSQEQLTSLNNQIERRDEALAQLASELALEAIAFSESISSLETLDALESDLDNLYELVRFNRISEKLSIQGLDAWAVMARAWDDKPELLATAFIYRYHSQLVSEVYEKELAIKEFDRVEHEKSIERFRSIDKQLFSFAQEELVEDLYKRLPNPSARGEVETLRREFNKKRRHLPIRRLLNSSGRAIQQIKPVFMMSPMSIATYLEPGSIEFDLVIFDEASQVKVADGLGAILRGKQVIVVGDTKQMPPTNFFGRQFTLDGEEAELSLTADIESILGMFLASGTPERMLKWHYRSVMSL
ncbi:DNA helicase related protein [Vibrio ishigakensis]|uniref:DNA helicase related protein n=1 Tax=Vibrio ishigakensis TaxID=1481914 RepID=A0A0B8PA09_9VIBR|nr:DNA helicase related protein [Vibrio ishigakensis]